MSFDFDLGTQSGATVGDGVFINTGKIVEAAIEYDALVHPSFSDPDDVVLRLVVDVDGLSWNKDLVFSGKYKTTTTADGRGQIIDKGSTFRVWDLFTEAGIKGTVAGGRLTDDAIVQQFVGKEITFLEYVAYMKDNGKPGYRAYKRAAFRLAHEDAEGTATRLRGWFDKDHAGGWLRGYKPELLTGGDGAASAPADVADKEEEEDDLPF